MTRPFFSVIIPALNEKGYLPHLLGDLAMQSFSSFEVIIVDGGSTDGTREYIQKRIKTDKRLHFLHSAQRNVSIQRNLGAQKAHGVWLLFVDADSRVDNQFLTQLELQLKKNDCEGFTCYAIADSTSVIDRIYVHMQNILLETMIAFGTAYSVGACMGCKRSVFDRLDGFNPNIVHMEDSELAKRIRRIGYIFRIFHRPTYVYSLRRQRKVGLVKFVLQLFPYYIKSLISNDFSTPAKLYPMQGGEQFPSSQQKEI